MTQTVLNEWSAELQTGSWASAQLPHSDVCDSGTDPELPVDGEFWGAVLHSAEFCNNAICGSEFRTGENPQRGFGITGFRIGWRVHSPEAKGAQ